MDRLRYRSVSVGALLLSWSALCIADHRADEVQVSATMSCDRRTEPGRVTCAVEARAMGDRSIAWADVELIELPAFTSALRGRIGPSDVTSRDTAKQAWAFGLVARKAGIGEARARLRAVVCEGEASASRCAPVVVVVRATIQVG